MGKRAVLRNKLRAYRRKFGVTQQELADRIGVKKSYLSEIERGGVQPEHVPQPADRRGLRRNNEGEQWGAAGGQVAG